MGALLSRLQPQHSAEDTRASLAVPTHIDVADDIRRGEDPQLQERAGQAVCGGDVRFVAGDDLAEERDGTDAGGQRFGDHMEAGRLLGAVGPDQSQDAAGRHREVHVVDGDDAVVLMG